MKAVPQDIQEIFFEVKNLVSGRIINAKNAAPIDITTHQVTTLKQAKDVLLKRNQGLGDPRIYIAQFWLVLAFLIIKEINALNNTPNIEGFFRPIMFAFLLVVLVIFYEITIGQLPFQKTVDKLILPKREYEQKQLEVAFWNARCEAEYKGPLSPWRFFNPDPRLEQIFNARKIPVMIHESILRALSALKHKSFDCVAVSSLVWLKLIEKKVPYTLKWYYKSGSDFDGHNFIVVVDHQNECFITDPWYDINTPFEQRLTDKNFPLRYPLLSTDDKSIMATITPAQFVHYQTYIDMMNAELSKQHRAGINTV
ncbi:MAG: hypothetical protein ABSF18_07365 [Gammaproteobacteria bacterium]|jgi:hypothetical protein